ncbi:unnamed protein product [Arctogadus glacialis]
MTAEMFDSSISISGLKLRGERQRVLFLLLLLLHFMGPMEQPCLSPGHPCLCSVSSVSAVTGFLSVPGSPLSLLSVLCLRCNGVPVCPRVTPVSAQCPLSPL